MWLNVTGAMRKNHLTVLHGRGGFWLGIKAVNCKKLSQNWTFPFDIEI